MERHSEDMELCSITIGNFFGRVGKDELLCELIEKKPLSHRHDCVWLTCMRHVLNSEALLQSVAFSLSAPFPSVFAAITNATWTMPRLTSNETLCRSNISAAGIKSVPRPEKKLVRLMKSILQKFTKPGEVVFDSFVATGATAKACFLKRGTKNLSAATCIVTAFSG